MGDDSSCKEIVYSGTGKEEDVLDKRIKILEDRIRALESENTRLRSQQKNAAELIKNDNAQIMSQVLLESPLPMAENLSRDQIERYSRQLLLEEGFGVKGQLKLLSSSVMIVGAGGIGSTG